MKRAMVAIVLTVLVFGVAFAATHAPKAVKLQGQMVCMWCDVVLPAEPDKKDEQQVCTAAFKTTDGKIYTLVPDEMGKELGSLSMHEQKVEIQGSVLPGSQILQVTKYKVIQKVEPVTPEQEPWFNY